MENKSKYIEATGIYLKSAINNIRKKNRDYLQPIFEAITNSMESIKIYNQVKSTNDNGIIKINIKLNRNKIKEVDEFDSIEIIDTGIGFNNIEFQRFVTLRDYRKNFNNKGTGRVQFLHYFKETHIESVYFDNEDNLYLREFTYSKKYLDKRNALIRIEKELKVENKDRNTKVIFKYPYSSEEEESYEFLKVSDLKAKLIYHYMAFFCENRDNIPIIKICKYIYDNNKYYLESDTEIIAKDIPQSDKKIEFEISYCQIEGEKITKLLRSESFKLRSFVISKDYLRKNSLYLVSKGELAKNISLDNIEETDHIYDNRYLFLLSGDYIDSKDGDTRGELNIYYKEDYLKIYKGNWDNSAQIFLDDIEKRTNRRIVSSYPEIAEKRKEKFKNLEELKKMFLLDEDTVKEANVKLNDSEKVILNKIYKTSSTHNVDNDLQLKSQIERIRELNTNDEDFQEKLSNEIDEFVKFIPLENRTSLTRYIARRQIVLNLFDDILKKELLCLKGGKRINEGLLHNLIFQQSSGNAEDSDLWVINEEFIYFKGTSEYLLGNIEYNGDKVLKETLTNEEKTYRLKQGGDANQKRPDILLFPKEGKCIIIELKAPEVNVSEHLNQVNRYASLINNLSKDKFKISTYYGYLIGENIDINDIEDNDSDFKSAHNLNYIFRPFKRIAGKFGNEDGSLYTEVIKYSTLLERAKLRNKIFIDKLDGKK